MLALKSIAAMPIMSRPNLLSFCGAALALCFFGSAAPAQQPAPGSRYDVTNYRIEVQLNPDEHVLRAGADITFVPMDATRSIVFELNGSLNVDGVVKDGRAITGVVQATVSDGARGPNMTKTSGQARPSE